TLLRSVRAAPPGGDDDEERPGEGRRMPVSAYVLAVLLIAATVVLVYFVLRSAVNVPEDAPVPTGPPRNGTSGGVPIVGGVAVDSRAVVLTVIAAVALALGVSALVRRHRIRPADELDDELTDHSADRAALAEAVAAAEEVLDSHGDDTRAAIIAAYLAMENQLVRGGTTRRPSDTPTDFLMRAVESSRVSRTAATRLTELFREARFSTHPMPRGARADASRALARVAEDLTDARR
ncbi:MAG: DUF4129 domain-containing protein, partial [Actinomycetes bacterium]